MRVLVAVDSFKGSMSSAEVGETIAQVIRAEAPKLDVRFMPVADGGEGTLDALGAAGRGTLVPCRARDLNGDLIDARYLRAGDSAYLEVAEVLSLGQARVPPALRTSWGVGELITHAVDAGAEHIVVCCGGTGTLDFGLGALHALAGLPWGSPSQELASAGVLRDLAVRARRRIGAATLVCAVDVDNALVGERDVLAFAPQKGFTALEVANLRLVIAQVATVFDAVGFEVDRLSSRPGTGAAGGLPAALCLLGATIVSAFDTLAAASGLDVELDRADVVVTGEGRLDRTTFDGKLVARLLAQTHPRLCLLVVGQATTEGIDLALAAGASAVFPLCADADVAAVISDPTPSLRQVAARLARVLLSRVPR